jgi:hypothetical protein
VTTPLDTNGFEVPSIETLTQWAKAALPGAPDKLIELCANIAWSVLNGANPNPDDRIIHGESIRFVAAALDGQGGEEVHDGVTSGTIDVVL